MHGYHVYKLIWDAVCDDILPCKREIGDHHNPCKGTIVVGHVLSKISILYSSIKEVHIVQGEW